MPAIIRGALDLAAVALFGAAVLAIAAGLGG